MIKKYIKELKSKLNKILLEASDGKLIKEGIKTVIIGRPNVGKSSILNKLLDEDRAIVTDIEGTTRDIVEGSFTISGVLFNVLDTAGIRETTNTIEQIGVKKSLSLINEADLVLLVLNNSEELTEEDRRLLDLTQDKKRIIFANKSDLNSKLVMDSPDVVYGSTLSTDGIETLKTKIKEMFDLERLEQSDLNFLSNSSQIALIKECLSIVKDIESGLENNLPLDMIEIDIKKIWELLGNLIGENSDDMFIDNLFSKFCVGK